MRNETIEEYKTRGGRITYLKEMECTYVASCVHKFNQSHDRAIRKRISKRVRQGSPSRAWS